MPRFDTTSDVSGPGSMEPIDHQSIRMSRERLSAIVTQEHQRLLRCRRRSRDLEQSRADAVEFDTLMTAARRDVDNVLTALDDRIETLRTKATRGVANDDDRASLRKLLVHRDTLKVLAENAFQRPLGINRFGVYDGACKGLALLDRYLLIRLRPDWRAENIPASPGTLPV